jgi:hypothetical protein
MLVSCSTQGKTDGIVLEFYDWYLSSVKNQSPKEYEPVMESDENGMTTLNIEKYVQNLRKYNCSENLIKREISSYQECIKNLEEVKFDALQFDFDYDEVGCSFVYYNRWTYSQEPIDGVKILEINSLQNNKQLVKGQFYNFDDTTNEYLYWNWYCYVLLIQENGEWKIDEIDVKNDE